jgi:hypothetical protein
MDLRTLQAQWVAGALPAERAHEAATALLLGGVESPALVELAGLYGAGRADVAPLIEQAVAEAGLMPIAREAAFWRVAYAAAEQVRDGRSTPLEGAALLWQCATELELPEALRHFVYLAADYGEGPNDPRTEAAWFDAKIRASVAELLAGMPPDRESPPRAAV